MDKKKLDPAVKPQDDRAVRAIQRISLQRRERRSGKAKFFEEAQFTGSK